MNLELRHHLAGQPRHAHVLHNQRVHSGARECHQIGLGLAEFAVKNQGVEGHETLYTSRVQLRHDVREFPQCEPHLCTGAEVVHSEENGVCPGFYGGAKGFQAPGRGHQFRLAGNSRHNALVYPFSSAGIVLWLELIFRIFNGTPVSGQGVAVCRTHIDPVPQVLECAQGEGANRINSACKIPCLS